MPPPSSATLAGLTVLERGWLSSNNVLLHGAPGEGAVLVDSGHCTHGDQTVALVRRALAGEPLGRVVNTHLHSDHCGGNAVLQRSFPGLPVDVPPGGFEAARRGDEVALSWQPAGQRCERFEVRGTIEPGSVLAVGERRWEVIAAPGHDPDAVMLFDAAQGVLISADALWGNGFGVVFPELDGEPGFDEVAEVLDLIARLPVAWVIPGHGPAFGDVAEALARARRRLASWRDDEPVHCRHAAKVLVKYHVMEERELALEDLRTWAETTPLFGRLFLREGFQHADSPAAWCERLVDSMCASGALARRGAWVLDVA